MIRHRVFRAKLAEPAMRQVQVNRLTQTALGANPEAVANDQHADDQRQVYRRTSGVTAVRRQVLMQSPPSQRSRDQTER